MSRPTPRVAPALVAFAALAAPALAAKPRAWTVSQPGHYEDARFKHATVSSTGTLRLARQLRPLLAPEAVGAAHVWDLAEDHAGNLFVATGDEGKLLRVTPDDRATIV